MLQFIAEKSAWFDVLLRSCEFPKFMVAEDPICVGYACEWTTFASDEAIP
jgi:hypothetical protein